MTKKKFLIIYSNLGLGPKRVSEPLEKHITSLGHYCETISLENIFPKFINNYLFELPVRSKKKILTKFENNINFEFNRFVKFFVYLRFMLILPFTLRKIKKKIKEVNPDGIIATSFLSAHFSMYWRKFIAKKYKIYGVLVDFHPSPIWYIAIDKIFTANDLSKKIIEKHVDKSTTIHVTGIPIPIKTTKKILPLNQRKEILLTGGGWGLGPFLEITKTLLSIEEIKKINIICGDNQTLKNQLETQFSTYIQNNKLKILGLINNIEEYYTNTRILISKAGGITLTEVPFFEIPMIITYVITGSEIENRKYFADNNACLLASTPEEICKTVNELLEDEEKSKTIIENAKNLVYPDSTEQIIKIILKD